MSFGENKGLWLSVGAVIIAGTALILILISAAPRTLVVLFTDVGELKVEDPVVWHDFVVGKVVKIDPLVSNQIGVTLRLNEDYNTRITHGTSFTLRRAALFGFVGKNAIDIEPPTSPGRPYENGEIVQGITPPKPTLAEEGKQLTEQYWQRLKEQAGELLEEYRKSPYKNEVEDALRQLEGLAQDGAKQAKDRLEQFHKDHQEELNSVMRKLEQARDWMRKKGDEAGAQRLQKEIELMKKD